MRREILVFIDHLKFRAYRKKVGNFQFAVNLAQIVIALFAIFGFFFSIVPGSHLLTLEKLSQEKELRVTELQNQIDESQKNLTQLNGEIAERDQLLKIDDVTFEFIVREEFRRELATEKDSYFDSQFKEIANERVSGLTDDQYAERINKVTLLTFYQNFLDKTKYGYAGFTEVRPIFVDIRQSFLKFLQAPPQTYSSDCAIQKNASGGGYSLVDIHGTFIHDDSYRYPKTMAPVSFIDVRRRCLNDVLDNLEWAWLSARASEKGPEGFVTNKGIVFGPKPK